MAAVPSPEPRERAAVSGLDRAEQLGSRAATAASFSSRGSWSPASVPDTEGLPVVV